ncbi:MAG: hypothetical protein A4E53_03540 [Pelotomaculum sp. PtaB.Bin104]|nr:MAG: hypothetical protein A4E53_03540 [Pelotomaculum sp. PtaB.Bin104]
MANKKRKVTMSWQEMVNYFIMTKRSEKSSDLTIRDYENKLSRFQAWFRDRYGDIAFPSIDKDIIREYIRYLSYEHTQHNTLQWVFFFDRIIFYRGLEKI